MTNRLKKEKSAYLKQHENNPVDWYPYGPEALKKAKDENRPIFLSIGYSSCHWCHVMAHESFENEDIAKYLNENYVCIKVDREEYPDLDNYYQQACQRFTQSGGWPLSAFLLPDMKPFFVGTYFPAEPKFGQTGFKEVIKKINSLYQDDRDKIESDAKKVIEDIIKGPPIEGERPEIPQFPPPMAILEALKELQDEKYGGYGPAPKFPNFAFLEWAVEQMLEGKVDQTFGKHIIDTIDKMLMGGINDHARGGIHRYSVDEMWLVPHFEKMLYDQAGLLKLLAKVGPLYPSPLVFDCIMDTLDYLENEMQSDKGFFFSAQDADSEGVEGLYQTFTLEEFEEALKNSDDEEKNLTKNLEKLKKWFRITDEGNFEKGQSVISLDFDYAQDIFTQEGWDLVRLTRKALLNERKNRVPPATDNKGVASWNFMALGGLIDVIQFCPIDPIKYRAQSILNQALKGSFEAFVLKEKGSEGDLGTKIRHTTTMDDSIPYIEDYVFFAEAMLRLYEISGNQDFKNNFKDTLSFIHAEFISEGKALTRAKTLSDALLYPNLNLTSFDSSFRSPLSTLISITRRGALLFQDPKILEPIKELEENLVYEVLRYPFGSGEALRALTYPLKAYKVIKVPEEWVKEPKFSKFITYFLPRFVIDYVEGEKEKWQICSLETCELQGEGIDNFMETLAPKEEPKDEK